MSQFRFENVCGNTQLVGCGDPDAPMPCERHKRRITANFESGFYLGSPVGGAVAKRLRGLFANAQGNK